MFLVFVVSVSPPIRQTTTKSNIVIKKVIANHNKVVMDLCISTNDLNSKLD